MDCRLVALDIDGTLTNSAKELTSRTRDALMTLQRRGVHVVLASGRPSYGLHKLAEELELGKHDGYLLAYNGSRVISCADGSLVTATTFPRPLLPELSDAARHFDVALLTYDDPKDTILATSMNEWVEHEAWINNNMKLELVPDIDARAPQDLPKCLMAGNPERMAQIVIELQKMFPTLEICRSAPFFVEIVPRGIDKAASLDVLCQRLGLTSANVAAFGDGHNDISMIKYAGVGVAMANAFDEVKAIADYITCDNDHDGVAEAIEKLKL